jgi:hypothetical protein
LLQIEKLWYSSNICPQAFGAESFSTGGNQSSPGMEVLHFKLCNCFQIILFYFVVIVMDNPPPLTVMHQKFFDLGS